MLKLLVISILTTSALGVLLVVSPLRAEPKAPHIMVGKVTNSQLTPVAAGANIQARIDNVNYSNSVDSINLTSTQNTVTHSLVGEHNYGVSNNFTVCADDPETSVKEGGAPSESIVFFINNVQATAIVSGNVVSSVPFSRGGSTTVDLIVGQGAEIVSNSNEWACTTYSEPTPVPSSGGGGGGGGGGAAAPAAGGGGGVMVSIATPVPSSGGGGGGGGMMAPTATPVPTAPIPATPLAVPRVSFVIFSISVSIVIIIHLWRTRRRQAN